MSIFEVTVENEKGEICQVLVKANGPGHARQIIEGIARDGVKVLRVEAASVS